MYGYHIRQQKPSLTPSNRRSSLSIIADCRLDNRASLQAQFDLDEALPPNPSDSDLILAAYRKWGLKTPEHLLGDFSFAITDSEKHSVFCARDHIGIAPLYRYLSESTFIFAGSIGQVVGSLKEPAKICEAGVAIYLRDGELYHDRLTFIEGIEKLPPAHAVLVTEKNVSEWTYWRPEDCPCVRGEPREKSIARLTELLQEAVRCRLPPGENVGLHLSGGLDSSSLTALAAKESAQVNCSLAAYSWMPLPESSEQALEPEWANGRMVADQYDIPLSYESFEPAQLLKILETHNIASGDTVDCWYEFGVRDKAVASSISTLITGWGGDQFITHHGVQYYFQTFWRGNVLPILRHFWSLSASSKRPLRDFFRLTYVQLVRPWMEALFGSPRQALEYLDTASDPLIALAQALPREFLQESHRSVRAHQLATNDRLHLNSRIESWASSGRRAGVEYRYPLLDKRIVEFALGIPADLYRSGGTTRYIFRQVVKDILPEQVWSAGKGQGEPVRLQKAMRTCIQALSQWNQRHGGEVIDSPFIDGVKLKSLLDDISKREPILNVDTYRAVATAIKSILILNMSLEHSRL